MDDDHDDDSVAEQHSHEFLDRVADEAALAARDEPISSHDRGAARLARTAQSLADDVQRRIAAGELAATADDGRVMTLSDELESERIVAATRLQLIDALHRARLARGEAPFSTEMLAGRSDGELREALRALRHP